jgi:hypothetical protein
VKAYVVVVVLLEKGGDEKSATVTAKAVIARTNDCAVGVDDVSDSDINLFFLFSFIDIMHGDIGRSSVGVLLPVPSLMQSTVVIRRCSSSSGPFDDDDDDDSCTFFIRDNFSGTRR